MTKKDMLASFILASTLSTVARADSEQSADTISVLAMLLVGSLLLACAVKITRDCCNETDAHEFPVSYSGSADMDSTVVPVVEPSSRFFEDGLHHREVVSGLTTPRGQSIAGSPVQSAKPTPTKH
jgi:hypothetical protein